METCDLIITDEGAFLTDAGVARLEQREPEATGGKDQA